jgi:hypothetical protein
MTDQCVCWGECWLCYVFVFEENCVGYSFALCLFNVYDVCVVSCIMLLWMCIRQTRYISTIVCEKQWLVCTLRLSHNREYFVKY